LSDGLRRRALQMGLTAAWLGLAANFYAALVNLPGPATDPAGSRMRRGNSSSFFAMLAGHRAGHDRVILSGLEGACEARRRVFVGGVPARAARAQAKLSGLWHGRAAAGVPSDLRKDPCKIGAPPQSSLRRRSQPRAWQIRPVVEAEDSRLRDTLASSARAHRDDAEGQDDEVERRTGHGELSWPET